MKKFILFSLFVVSTFFSTAQSHFSTRLELRLENGHVFADLIALNDYAVASLQFGFFHDSESSTYIGLNSQILEPTELKSNEVCPKYVRLLWTNPTGINTFLKKGDVILTLEYSQSKVEDHFICMMKSPQPLKDNCVEFYREVATMNQITYVVDDVCIYYSIDNGQIKLDADDLNTSDIKISYSKDNSNITVIYPQTEINSEKYFELINLQGQTVIKKLISSSDVSVSTAGLIPNQYIALVKSNGKITRSKKLFVF